MSRIGLVVDTELGDEEPGEPPDELGDDGEAAVEGV